MAPDPHTAQEYEDIKPADPNAASSGKSSAEPSTEGFSPNESVTDDPARETDKGSDAPDDAARREAADAREAPPEAVDADSAQTAEEAASDDLAYHLLAAEQQAEEHRNGMLRVQAEMENLRRRSAREIENAHKYGLDGFVRELLPVKDSMELGITAAEGKDVEVASLREGMGLTLKMFDAAMEKFGVEEVSPAPGEPFDHERHQAISVQEDKEQESGAILTIVQKGCLLNGRLIRPAMVIVNK
uniref:Protein GrpE n=1 Tax=Candidatus Kentrum eta TaxID=2126337 RepID=A0A450VCH7_9GAMM|nr:MAG: molecular chaperone GrpE [Candidatus Kentron sp. H]VFJ96652.1 MAG: molecular chaperone GrpE [Candidatus Kentron sp. H]VFK02485.1 MAG: molecular chaperone GrpE [Candidatus Kentron sp. H]